MVSDSIKRMRKAMIAEAIKGFTMEQIKNMISQLLKIDSDITNEFKKWLIKKIKALEK